HREYVHITPQVESALKKSGVKDGMVLVSAMHITAGVYVNDNESGLIEDIDEWLEKLAPFRQDYRHHKTGEDNGDSHLKAILVHPLDMRWIKTQVIEFMVGLVVNGQYPRPQVNVGQSPEKSELIPLLRDHIHFSRDIASFIGWAQLH